MSSSPESDESPVLLLMKRRLPPYIVKCFQAAGYDERETISRMDISESTGNSINKIELYIQRKFSDNHEYIHDSSMLSSPFEFPPGHRDRICHFVQEVRALKDKGTTNKRKQGSTIKHTAKRPKTEVGAVENHEVNADTISKQIRDTIKRWVQQQTDPALNQLAENQHYRLLVSTDNDSPSVSMMCLVCKKSITLRQRDSSNKCSPFIISNWTRHGKKCYAVAHTRAAESTQQSKLDQYFGCNKVSQQQPSSITTIGESPMDNSEISHPDAQSNGLSTDCSISSSLSCTHTSDSNSHQVF